MIDYAALNANGRDNSKDISMIYGKSIITHIAAWEWKRSWDTATNVALCGAAFASPSDVTLPVSEVECKRCIKASVTTPQVTK